MEPNAVTTLVIQNPGEEAVVITAATVLSADAVIDQHGSQIKQGAFVSLTQSEGGEVNGEIFVADRIGASLYLQNNEFLSHYDAPDVDDIGTTVTSGEAAELETFTVFGINDDHEKFVAVITATEETALEVGVRAGMADEGCEHLVSIATILKGDQTGLESVSI